MARRPSVLLYGRPELTRFGALAEGLHAEGLGVAFSPPKYFRAHEARREAVAVVVDGLGREAAPVAAAYRRIGVPVWIVELPRLREEADAVALLRDSLHWLRQANHRVPVVAHKVKSDKSCVVVALQKENDAAHGMDIRAINAFARQAVAMAKADGLPLVVRPHPTFGGDVPPDAWGADRVSLPSEEPLADVLAQAAKVITYNSTVGWDAIAAGVPVYPQATACSYGEYAGPLTAKQRTDALARAAACQWTMAELRDGSAVRHTILADVLATV